MQVQCKAHSYKYEYKKSFYESLSSKIFFWYNLLKEKINCFKSFLTCAKPIFVLSFACELPVFCCIFLFCDKPLRSSACGLSKYYFHFHFINPVFKYFWNLKMQIPNPFSGHSNRGCAVITRSKELREILSEGSENHQPLFGWRRIPVTEVRNQRQHLFLMKKVTISSSTLSNDLFFWRWKTSLTMRYYWSPAFVRLLGTWKHIDKICK